MNSLPVFEPSFTSAAAVMELTILGDMGVAHQQLGLLRADDVLHLGGHAACRVELLPVRAGDRLEAGLGVRGRDKVLADVGSGNPPAVDAGALDAGLGEAAEHKAVVASGARELDRQVARVCEHGFAGQVGLRVVERGLHTQAPDC